MPDDEQDKEIERKDREIESLEEDPFDFGDQEEAPVVSQEPEKKPRRRRAASVKDTTTKDTTTEDEVELDRLVDQCISYLDELSEDEESLLVIRIYPINRDTGKVFSTLSMRVGQGFVQLHAPVADFVNMGIPTRIQPFILAWHITEVSKKVNTTRVAYRIVPHELYRKNLPPAPICRQGRADCVIHKTRSSVYTKKVGTVVHERMLVARTVVGADPILFRLPAGFDTPVSRSYFITRMEQIGRTPKGFAARIARELDKYGYLDVLGLAVAVHQERHRSEISHNMMTGEKVSQNIMETEWFDLPIQRMLEDARKDITSITRGRYDEDKRSTAASTLSKFFLDIMNKVKPGRMSRSYPVIYLSKGAEETIVTRGSVQYSPGTLNRGQRNKHPSRQHLAEHLRDAVMMALDLQSDIVTERAGGMYRPHIRGIMLSREYLVPFVYGMYFNQVTGKVCLHCIFYILPRHGQTAGVLTIYELGSKLDVISRLDVYRLSQPAAGTNEDFPPEILMLRLMSWFFTRTTDCYRWMDKNPQPKRSPLRGTNLSHQGVLTVRLKHAIVRRMRSIAFSYFWRFPRRLERAPLKLRLPDIDNPDRVHEVVFKRPEAAVVALSLAGIAGASSHNRWLARDWIISAEKAYWHRTSMYAASLHHLLASRWLKVIFKFGALSAYAAPVLKQVRPLAYVMTLREFIGLRYSIPVRPVMSSADVDITYAFRGGKTEVIGVDHEVPREYWGHALVPREKLLMDVLFGNPDYFAQLARQTMITVVENRDLHYQLKQMVQDWGIELPRDEKQMEGGKFEESKLSENVSISSLILHQAFPELFQAISELFVYPEIFSQKNRKT